MEFQVGDKVMLKVSPWKGIVRFGKRGKLNPRVHNTFHVSNLKKCHADEPLAVPLDGLHFDDKLHFVEKPVEIMDREVKRLKRSRISLVKIEKEVYVCQPPRFEDPDFPGKVYKVEKALYRLHQAPRACSHDDEFKPSSDDGKKVDDDPSKESECNDQEKEDNVNNNNNVNTVSLTVNAAGTNEDNELPSDPNMHALEDVSIFNFSSDDEDDDTMAVMNNLDTTIQFSPTPTIRIHKDHPLDQIIKDLHSAT
nr:putative reverse transcriptase domain-containing protein [Tanacetum cinerariifolium]